MRKRHLTAWTLFFNDALGSVTDLGDPEVVKAERMHCYTSLDEVMLMLLSVLRKQLDDGNLCSMTHLHAIMHFIEKASEADVPNNYSAVYPAPIEDAKLKNAWFNYRGNHAPSVQLQGNASMVVYFLMDSFRCQSAKEEHEEKTTKCFREWVGKLHCFANLTFRIIPECASKQFKPEVEKIIQNCPSHLQVTLKSWRLRTWQSRCNVHLNIHF